MLKRLNKKKKKKGNKTLGQKGNCLVFKADQLGSSGILGTEIKN